MSNCVSAGLHRVGIFGISLAREFASIVPTTRIYGVPGTFAIQRMDLRDVRARYDIER